MVPDTADHDGANELISCPQWHAQGTPLLERLDDRQHARIEPAPPNVREVAIRRRGLSPSRKRGRKRLAAAIRLQRAKDSPQLIRLLRTRGAVANDVPRAPVVAAEHEQTVATEQTGRLPCDRQPKPRRIDRPFSQCPGHFDQLSEVLRKASQSRYEALLEAPSTRRVVSLLRRLK